MLELGPAERFARELVVGGRALGLDDRGRGREGGVGVGVDVLVRQVRDGLWAVARRRKGGSARVPDVARDAARGLERRRGEETDARLWPCSVRRRPQRTRRRGRRRVSLVASSPSASSQAAEPARRREARCRSATGAHEELRARDEHLARVSRRTALGRTRRRTDARRTLRGFGLLCWAGFGVLGRVVAGGGDDGSTRAGRRAPGQEVRSAAARARAADEPAVPAYLVVDHDPWHDAADGTWPRFGGPDGRS